jgi:hypothetical protein
MGVCVGDLDLRQIELLRVELAEALAANFAYPPFFDYAVRQAHMRPVDQAKRDEIDEYVRSANLTAIERADVTAPEVRRFIERLFTRYLEVNPALARPRLQRRAPELRARVPRVAAETQRALVAYTGGEGTGFGTRRQRTSWAATSSRAGAAIASRERNTRVVEAVLARRHSGEPGMVSRPLPAVARTDVEARHGEMPVRQRTDTESRLAAAAGTPGKMPAVNVPVVPSTSPFAGLEIGSQSTAFASISGIADWPTGSLIEDGTLPSDSGHLDRTDGQFSRGAPRELPPDLYRLYGEYLRDMQPDAPSSGPLDDLDEPEAEDPPTMVLPGVSAPAATPSTPAASAPVSDRQPAVRPAAAAPPTVTPSDQPIFWQLRYQLEAYVRRAARSYGIAGQSADPSGVLDALRRAGFVDESDLRIAEGILALTDRVTDTGVATIDDYRQALTLYLLYHRSHLGE